MQLAFVHSLFTPRTFELVTAKFLELSKTVQVRDIFSRCPHCFAAKIKHALFYIFKVLENNLIKHRRKKKTALNITKQAEQGHLHAAISHIRSSSLKKTGRSQMNN